MTAAASDPDRELRATAYADAPPARVWQLLTDLDAMPRRSPELVRMVALLPGGLRLGQQYLGLNRRGAIGWPTRSVVVGLEPGRVLAWETRTSGTRWIWELEPEGDGTRVVHRRLALVRRPLARTFARLLLGGVADHADELEAGMLTTVTALCREAEGR